MLRFSIPNNNMFGVTSVVLHTYIETFFNEIYKCCREFLSSIIMTQQHFIKYNKHDNV